MPTWSHPKRRPFLRATSSDRGPGTNRLLPKICIAHGGGYLPYYAGRVDRNFEEKPFTRVNMTKSPSEYMREHFWYDSCVYNVDMLEFLAQKVGVSRIVMGSDYPVGEHDPVGFVMKARGLSSEDVADILGRNAARLLGLSL